MGAEDRLEALLEFFGTADSEGQSHGNGRSLPPRLEEIFQEKKSQEGRGVPEIPICFHFATKT